MADKLIYASEARSAILRADPRLAYCIDNIKGVDAVEVVHGRWEDMWDGKYANPRYRCSVCKEKANYKSVQDELLSWHDVQVLTPYCPYCMAKLDGGTKNEI